MGSNKTSPAATAYRSQGQQRQAVHQHMVYCCSLRRHSVPQVRRSFFSLQGTTQEGMLFAAVHCCCTITTQMNIHTSKSGSSF